MAHAEHRHPTQRTYLWVWFWLFVLSFSSYFVELMHLPTFVKAFLLTCLGMMKGGLIVAYFMHLRFERLNLVYSVLLPCLLLVALLVALLYEGTTVPMLVQR